MLPAAARVRIAALRQPRRLERVAIALWITWAVLAWNVVFDHIVVVSGREYIAAATRAAFSATLPHPYENMDAWMRPAVTRGLWTASLSAVAIAAAGLILVRATRSGVLRERGTSCA